MLISLQIDTSLNRIQLGWNIKQEEEGEIISGFDVGQQGQK